MVLYLFIRVFRYPSVILTVEYLGDRANTTEESGLPVIGTHLDVDHQFPGALFAYIIMTAEIRETAVDEIVEIRPAGHVFQTLHEFHHRKVIDLIQVYRVASNPLQDVPAAEELYRDVLGIQCGQVLMDGIVGIVLDISLVQERGDEFGKEARGVIDIVLILGRREHPEGFEHHLGRDRIPLAEEGVRRILDGVGELLDAVIQGTVGVVLMISKQISMRDGIHGYESGIAVSVHEVVDHGCCLGNTP